MGENLVEHYHKYVKREYKIAFLSAFIFCFFVHIYKFTNTLPNHDSFFNVYSDQDMTVSGRWFLQYACGISSYFDLPWFIGLLCTIYLSLTAVVITDLFSLRNPIVIVLASAILVANPATTETLFFEFTADGYFLGMLMSALAANLTCKHRNMWLNGLAGFLLCLSCGIYQAYLSFAVNLCIFYLIDQLLSGNVSPKEALKWCLRHVILYSIVLIVYYALWQLALAVTGVSAAHYQGIDEIGKSPLPSPFGSLKTAILNFVFYFLEWNIAEHPITLYAALNILFFIWFTGAIVWVLFRHKVNNAFFVRGMVFFCLVCTIPISSIWCFVSATLQYRPMMLHSLCVFYIFGLILFDKMIKPRWSNLFGLLVASIILVNAINANISYFYLHKCYEKSYYTASQMMEEIEINQENHPNIQKIAFIGLRAEEVDIATSLPGSKNHLLNTLLENDLMFDHIHSCLFLKNVLGMELPFATPQELISLEECSAVQGMGVWPASDSVKEIDNILVFRLK